MRICRRCGVEKDLNLYRSDRLVCKQCESLERSNRDLIARRALVVDLGGSCVCCGEQEYEFLQIDHKENNGGSYRRNLRPDGRNGGITVHMMRKHIDELQLLCANCHLSKTIRGTCVHVRVLA